MNLVGTCHLALTPLRFVALAYLRTSAVTRLRLFVRAFSCAVFALYPLRFVALASLRTGALT